MVSKYRLEIHCTVEQSSIREWTEVHSTNQNTINGTPMALYAKK